MNSSTIQPKIYVACLSAYNCGFLHGTWIDADQDPADISEEIQAMLKNSPVADTEACEEWAIHDYEFEGIAIHESEDLDYISRLAAALIEHGEPLVAWIKDGGSIEDMEDHYWGEYEDEEDFAWTLWAEDGKIGQIENAGIHPDYLDWKAIARDLFLDSFWCEKIGYQKIFVFSRY